MYVDNILITIKNEEEIVNVKLFLHQQFTIKDLGYVKYFLALEIARLTSGMFLNQRKFVSKHENDK